MSAQSLEFDVWREIPSKDHGTVLVYVDDASAPADTPSADAPTVALRKLNKNRESPLAPGTYKLVPKGEMTEQRVKEKRIIEIEQVEAGAPDEVVA